MDFDTVFDFKSVLLLSVIALSSCVCLKFLFNSIRNPHFNIGLLMDQHDNIQFQPLTGPFVVTQTDMVKVEIPFSLEVLHAQEATLLSLEVCIKCKDSCILHTFWAFPVKYIHQFLQKTWPAFQDLMEADTSEQEKWCQYVGKTIRCDGNCDIIQELCDEKVTKIELGPPPRQYYPLVVVLRREHQQQERHPDNIVAMIYFIHVCDGGRDSNAPSTHILGQYLKKENGTILDMQQLYVATGSDENSDETHDDIPSTSNPHDVPSTSNSSAESAANNELPQLTDPLTSSSERLCLICDLLPLSRALLPCRHTCVCSQCFSRLDKCPICRGIIQSFFLIRAEDYPIPEPEPIVFRKWSDWLLHWNGRLNRALGFPND